MVATVEMAVLASDPESRAAVPKDGGVRVLREPAPRLARGARHVFVLAAASDLPRVTEFVRYTNGQHRLRALFIRDDVDARLLPQMLSRANLRVPRNTLVHSGVELPRRVMRAWRAGAQNQLIATAQVIDDTLLVVSCALEVFEIGFETVPALRGMPPGERDDFVVSEEGSYLHWPGRDVHLDLDGLRYVSDAAFRARKDTQRLVESQQFGAAVARVRKARGLRQTDFSGLSDRQVRRIEHGEHPSLEALGTLARGHEMSLEDYLDAVAAEVHPTMA